MTKPPKPKRADKVLLGGVDVTPHLRAAAGHRAQLVFTAPGADNPGLRHPIIKPKSEAFDA